jgi:hypothetical protein
MLREPKGRLADQHLPGLRHLLEPSCHVHGITRHELLARGGIAGHDLTGVHADPA